jgi:hypothetical protein
MKTAVEERELERSDNFKESQFTIKNSVKAFRILSDGLYQDKIKAIIRELSCNAYDAHIEAGTQSKKFDVFLPTSFDHTFYIRDYGTGLSKPDIENIYTTYFESTKTNSNDVVGCLGLGSKSPFSYVDMFTVTSFFNGDQYIYSAFINEEGLPSISLINESKTNEENGLKIQFAVKRQDFREFSYKASDVFFHFEDKPNFTGNVPNISKRSYTVKKKTWGLSNDRHSLALAIMGNVAYPINLDKCDFTSAERSILTHFAVDMFFEIGDLEVAANREGLSYNERTTNEIMSRVREIIKDEKTRVENDLSKQKCYWDAVIWINKEKKSNRIVNLLFDRVKLSYDGRDIESSFPIPRYSKNRSTQLRLTLSRIGYKTKYSYGNHSSSKYIGKSETIWQLMATENCKFFINDCKTRHIVRVKHFLENNQDVNNVYLIKSDEPQLIAQIIDHLGIIKSEVKLLSSIEPPKVQRKKAGERASGYLVNMKWGCSRHSQADTFWKTIDKDQDFDIEEGGFYMPINRWKVIHNDREHAPRDLLCTINDLYYSIKGFKNYEECPKVYGIKKAKLEKLEKNKKWINWIDYVQQIIKDHALDPKVFSELQMSNSEHHTLNYGSLSILFDGIRTSENFKNKKNPRSIVGSKFFKKCDCDVIKELARRFDFGSQANKSSRSGKNRALVNFIQSGKSILEESDIENLNCYVDKHQELMNIFRDRYMFADSVWGKLRTEAGISHMLRYINAMTNYNLTEADQGE